MGLRLTLENTNFCNLRCVTCPNRTLERPRGFMPWDLFQRILKQLPQEGVERVALYGNGEPLLESVLEGRIILVREYLPHAFIYIFTNGVLLGRGRAESLREAGLDGLAISLNYGIPSTYREVTGSDGFWEVVGNAKDAIGVFPPGKVMVQSLHYFRWRIGKQKESREFMWKHFAGNVFHHYEHNYAGRNSYGELDEFWAHYNASHPGSCPRLVHDYMTVLWDGRVVLCCLDVEGEEVLGDLKEQTFSEVRNSTRRVALREGRESSFLCGGCHGA